MIGGNQIVDVQISTAARNAIGEAVKSWETVQCIHGWLDLTAGESRYTTYNAKIQESTHVVVSDYVALDSRIKAENSLMMDEDGLIYDVLLIDDPMKLHKQLEIYLKYTGGQ